jgi:hypothetical protein
MKIECQSCKGTGLYVGMAEKEGLAVICHDCEGKGYIFFSYNEFTGKKKRRNITHVISQNPGFMLSPDYVSDGDKITYDDWYNGKTVVSEFRDKCCPKQIHNDGGKACDDANTEYLGRWYSECIAHEGHGKACWTRYDKTKVEK